MGDNLPPIDLGSTVLPVELTCFEALLDGSTVTLHHGAAGALAFPCRPCTHTQNEV